MSVLRFVLASLLILVLTVVSQAAFAQDRQFRASLSGAQEVPSADTRARGQAVFQFSEDGQGLHYKLIVANIDDVLMAHIHLAPTGQNGGIVLWLYPSAPPPVLIDGRTDGILAQGTVTAANLVGDLSGESLETLAELMGMGMAYVNVHTSAFGGGEVRGQIR